MRWLMLIGNIVVMLFSVAYAQMGETLNTNSSADQMCGHIQSEWRWVSGQGVDLADVQSKLSNMPSFISAVPPRAIHAVLNLTTAPNLTFYCQGTPNQSNQGVIYFTYGTTDNPVRMESIHLVINNTSSIKSVCERMLYGWGWRDGQTIDLASVQGKLNHPPAFISLTPQQAVNDVLNLTTTDLTLHCTNSSTAPNQATLYFTYTERGDTQQTTDINVTISMH
jgi:hypothetical protein